MLIIGVALTLWNVHTVVEEYRDYKVHACYILRAISPIRNASSRALLYCCPSDYQTALQTVTTVRQVFEETLDFPAVTVCNANPVHCLNLYRHIVHLNNGTAESDDRADRLDVLCHMYVLGRCVASNAANDLFRHGRKGVTPEVCQDR